MLEEQDKEIRAMLEFYRAKCVARAGGRLPAIALQSMFDGTQQEVWVPKGVVLLGARGGRLRWNGSQIVPLLCNVQTIAVLEEPLEEIFQEKVFAKPVVLEKENGASLAEALKRMRPGSLRDPSKLSEIAGLVVFIFDRDACGANLRALRILETEAKERLREVFFFRTLSWAPISFGPGKCVRSPRHQSSPLLLQQAYEAGEQSH